MHILTGRAALQALRVMRVREYDGIGRQRATGQSARRPLPHPTLPMRNVILDADPLTARRRAAYDASPSPTDDDFADELQRTLEEVGFPFEHVVANTHLNYHPLPALAPIDAGNPLELGVFDRSRRTRRATFHVATLNRRLPLCGLVSLNEDLYLSSPELIVAQLASTTDTIALAQVIMELCGTYALNPLSDASTGEASCAFDLEPVTTLARISSFATHAPRVRGRATIYRAIGYAREASASAGETDLALVFSLPPDIDAACRMGGLGFAKPQLNAHLDVPVEKRGHVSQDSYRLDVFFQEGLVDLEYESTEFHLDPLAGVGLPLSYPEDVARWRTLVIDREARDRRRGRDLSALGIQVIPVLASDLASAASLDHVAWAYVQAVRRAGGPDLEGQLDALDDHASRQARTSLLAHLRQRL